MKTREAEDAVLHAQANAQQFAASALQTAVKIREAEAAARNAQAVAEEAAAQAEQAQAHLQTAEARMLQAERTLSALYASRSWRLTAPLRWVGLQAWRLRDQGLAARVKALAKRTLRGCIAFVNARPKLRNKCIAWAQKFGLYEAARVRYWRLTGQAPAAPLSAMQSCHLHEALAQLSPRAQHIYDELKAAIEKNRKSR